MKKITAFFIFTIISLKIIAQIPNPNFENWTQYTGYSDPTGWTTPNSLTYTYYNKVVVTTDTNSYRGDLAVQLKSQYISGFGTAPGAVILGQINTNGGTISITGGVPFSGSPDSLDGWYQYTPAVGKTDSFAIIIILTYWDTSMNKRDTIASGGIENGIAVKNYKMFSVPLVYYSLYAGKMPDSLQMFIVSSYNPSENRNGSTMLLDDLFFTSMQTGIRSITDKGFNISCYPNPAKNNFNMLISEPQQGMLVKVYDVMGRIILSATIEELMTSIDVSNLSNGIYFYEVFDNRKNLLKTDKFSVLR